MADLGPDEQFWDLVDKFIESANKNCEEGCDPGVIAEALLYAASRFSAFLIAASSASREDFREDREESFRHFSRQFRKMLAENLDDHDKNFTDWSRSG